MMASSSGAPRPFIQTLPKGPPPLGPSKLLLGLNEARRTHMKKIKGFSSIIDNRHLNRFASITKKKKDQLEYILLDSMKQLTLLSQSMKQHLHPINLKLVKADEIKLALEAFLLNLSSKMSNFNKGARLNFKKHNHNQSAQWPLILLSNPRFLTNLMSDPNFLVSLFNTIETAYVSMPRKNLWLKPLLKIVSQRAPEKEERIWWRRKQHYDLMNGPNASELEPNLQSKGFRTVHKAQGHSLILKPAKLAIPATVALLRKLTQKRPPDPSYYKYPKSIASSNHIHSFQPSIEHANMLIDTSKHPIAVSSPIWATSHVVDEHGGHKQSQYYQNWDHSNLPPEGQASNELQQPIDSSAHDQQAQQHGDQLLLASSPLMSESELANLDPHELELIYEQAKRHFEESSFTDKLIKEHTDFIESITKRELTVGMPALATSANERPPDSGFAP